MCCMFHRQIDCASLTYTTLMPCFSNDDNTLLAVAFRFVVHEFQLGFAFKSSSLFQIKSIKLFPSFHIFWIIIVETHYTYLPNPNSYKISVLLGINETILWYSSQRAIIIATLFIIIFIPQPLRTSIKIKIKAINRFFTLSHLLFNPIFA